MSACQVESVQSEIESKLTIDQPETTVDQSASIDASGGSAGDSSVNDSASNKQKKKLNKLAESILKKSPGAHKLVSVEDKFYAMIQSYLDLQEQNKKLSLQGKEVEKSLVNVTKHRDIIQTDYNKAVFAKDKLESLCRELQKHNKQIKEENLQRIKEEEEKRKEITSKFQLAIDEINTQVGANSEKNSQLVVENGQLSAKLKNLIEQYEVREKHIEKVLKHKDLEIELANAKLQQSELKLAEAVEHGKHEKAIYENHIKELTKKCEFHIETEKQLKAQLSMYTEKYEEFQSTLKKSNQVFESFKAEMDKMTKKIKKLEQETASWKGKWESSEKSLANVIKQKDELDEKIKKQQARGDIMENLSRTLQTERNELKEKLKKYEQVAVKENDVVVVNEKPEVVDEVKPTEQATTSDQPQPPVAQSSNTEATSTS